eukprot:Amastigsp_a841017_609.p5 type:complete len:122 gc:universal Amastigsp_a841017_609:1518-1153(-)
MQSSTLRRSPRRTPGGLSSHAPICSSPSSAGPCSRVPTFLAPRARARTFKGRGRKGPAFVRRRCTAASSRSVIFGARTFRGPPSPSATLPRPTSAGRGSTGRFFLEASTRTRGTRPSTARG